ncbi:asparaginyl-tRNA synthetase [Scheffersomyces xylosifermentans]|uniref:asparaginyl-tRNA synthetase n=1 Tax=Scheffersomyces xylosifermentans TaxID=1304137 RepID=UPI00315C63E2
MLNRLSVTKTGPLSSLARLQRAYLSGTGLSPTIKELLLVKPPAVDSTVVAQGHIRSIRQGKSAGFVDVSDGSIHSSLNIVVKNPLEVFSKLQLKVGQSIAVKGQWVESQGTQEYELVYNSNDSSHSLSVIGDVPESYPIQKKATTYQNLRNYPTLRHRTSTLASILRFRSYMEAKFFEFFNSRDFVKVVPPLITSSDCEGAGEQFVVESLAKTKAPIGKEKTPEDYFFGKATYMTVSTQLHLEVLALSLNRAWTLTPCFRAEDSNTNRHLSEFWMLEAEICYIDDLEQLTAFTEEMIRYVTKDLVAKAEDSLTTGGAVDLIGSRFKKEDIEIMKGRWNSILSEEKWPSITYTEAIEIINRVMNKGRSKNRLQWGDSIQTPHEKWLAGEHFKSPLFITDYPSGEKPFYMPKSKNFDPARPTVACYDLILPEIGELVGGSMREHNYENLIAEMKRRDMNIEDMQWYLSTRINGTVPHGGFGMGFERLIAYLSAMENVKDVIPFPRVPESCQC